MDFKRHFDVTDSNIFGRDENSGNINRNLDVDGYGAAAFILFNFNSLKSPAGLALILHLDLQS
jgi:hypothetical protein